MPLTKDDLEAVRGIVAKELDARAARIGEIVVAAVTAALDEKLALVGPLASEWAKAEVDKVVPSVLDALSAAKGELRQVRELLDANIVATGNALGTLDRKSSETLGRVMSIESMLGQVRFVQGIGIQQSASIRESLMPGEKSAVSETPPAFDGELAVESEQKTDASPPTEAD